MFSLRTHAIISAGILATIIVLAMVGTSRLDYRDRPRQRAAIPFEDLLRELAHTPMRSSGDK